MKVRIFQDCEQGLLGELVMKLKLQVSKSSCVKSKLRFRNRCI